MQPTAAKNSVTIRNFGRNVTFSSQYHEQASSEDEVLEILKRHQGRRVRAYGSLHSWSQVAATDGVAVNISQLNRIRLNADGPDPTVTVEAGCQIKRLVAELNLQGWTTPTLGLIMEQTIAGATATATHGSGRHCFSHYIRSLRLATYDTQGNPVIREIAGGEELQAACCSLGMMGIVTEVVIPIRRQYSIEEHFGEYEELGHVIAAESEYPLQQFYFIPWKWVYLAQHRRQSQASRSRTAPLYRAFWAWGMDHGLHWIIIALARWMPDPVCPLTFRYVLANLVPRGWRVVDRSDRQLTMQHQLYRHIETELFVKGSHLQEMLDLTRWILQRSAGRDCPGRDEWTEAIHHCGISSEFDRLKGGYRHHYPICIRKVEADKGFITMSGSDDNEAFYAVSFISYARPGKREGFIQFSDVITQLSGYLLSTRPHWGKYFHRSAKTFQYLYPHYDKFMAIRDQMDPQNAFSPTETSP